MAQNKILPWAQTSTANTLSDADYASAIATNGAYADGVKSGQASSQQANKTWRQATAPGAGLGQFLVDNLGVDVTDADDPSTFSTRIANAILKLAQISPFNQSFAAAIGGYRKYAIVSDSSGNFWVSTADQNVTVPGDSGAKWQSLFDGYLTQSNAASTYVKKSGDASTGTQYSSGWFWGGYNAGFGGGTATGALRWTNFGVAFGNPLASTNSSFSGNICVSDVIGNVNDNSSGINMRGYDYRGTLYNWFFAWNGKVTTPGGVLAFESDLLAYFSAAPNSSNVTLTNLQGVNWTSSATNSYVQVTGGGISLAVPTVAYTSKQVSDEATLRANADTALQNQINGKLDSSFVASGIFDGSQGSTTSGTIVGGTWLRVGNTLTQNLVIENIGGGTVTYPFAFSGNNKQVVVIVQDGTGSNNTYTTGSITTTGTGIHASGGGGTGRLHLTVSGPYGT